MPLTYDVELWAIRKRTNRPKPHQVRWRVGKQEHSKSFRVKPQAQGRFNELLSAIQNRERFDEATGLPESELRELTSPTWFEHAQAYVLMKWPDSSAKHRASIAEALATVTPALVSDARRAPEPDVLRRALYRWAFRCTTGADGKPQLRSSSEAPPSDVAAALDWIAAKSLKVSELRSAKNLRPALNALLLKMDGSKAAANTVRRKYPVFTNALRYAVEQEHLPALPVTSIDWKAPRNTEEVDFRYVPNREQVDALLAAVAERGERGRHLKAYFACIYYAAMRPEEVSALTRGGCKLPEDGWGELQLTGSCPNVSGAWTDSGKPYEERELKKRAQRAIRTVPIPPSLVRLLREHVEQFGTDETGRLFRSRAGGPVRSNEYSNAWERARKEALTPEETASPLAKRPYDLRHACVSLWLHAGVSPVEVARRAGQSVEVLYRVYAKVLKGLNDRSNELIERALGS